MKAFWLKLALAILSVLAPIQGVMLSALVLILCDLITGVLRAKKEGKSITSAGFQRTIVKITVYEVAIALGFVAQHYLMGDSLPITNIIGSYIGLTELTSVYENMNGIAGTDLLKSILEKLNSKNS